LIVIPSVAWNLLFLQSRHSSLTTRHFLLAFRAGEFYWRGLGKPALPSGMQDKM
jgi:hypothetical protein